MQRFFSAASQNRDPGFFLESRVTGTPALQRTAPQVLSAALRPGHEKLFRRGLERPEIGERDRGQRVGQH
jgi:hypothetical protein